MSKVLTFSRTFPSYHPKAGESTYFIEKIIGGLVANDVEGCDTPLIKSLRDSRLLSISVLNEITGGTYAQYKHHTIRAGHRWKVGDYFSPRVWSDKPYNSKQIQFAPDIQVKKVWDFEIKPSSKELPLDYDTDIVIDHRFYNIDTAPLEALALNDGLTRSELLSWFKFPKPFDGQIIAWNENIEY